MGFHPPHVAMTKASGCEALPTVVDGIAFNSILVVVSFLVVDSILVVDSFTMLSIPFC
jgi:hypothetical protein